MNDFKHGNYLQHKETGEIIVYSPEHLENDIRENYEGVPLSENWLKGVTFPRDAKLDRTSFIFNSGTKSSMLTINDGRWSGKICYKVHELQNSVKEITGFDIIITPPLQ